jgi:hypothetical protein
MAISVVFPPYPQRIQPYRINERGAVWDAGVIFLASRNRFSYLRLGGQITRGDYARVQREGLQRRGNVEEVWRFLYRMMTHPILVL